MSSRNPRSPHSRFLCFVIHVNSPITHRYAWSLTSEWELNQAYPDCRLSSCVSFLRFLSQVIINVVASNHTNVLSYSAGDQKCELALTGEQRGFGRPGVLLEALGKDPFPCLLNYCKIPGCLCSLTHGPFCVFQDRNSVLSPMSCHFSDFKSRQH